MLPLQPMGSPTPLRSTIPRSPVLFSSVSHSSLELESAKCELRKYVCTRSLVRCILLPASPNRFSLNFNLKFTVKEEYWKMELNESESSPRHNDSKSSRIFEKAVFMEYGVPGSYSNAVRLNSKTGNNVERKTIKNQQQEDRILFRHVPRKKMVEESRESVFAQTSFFRSFDLDFDGKFRVRSPSATKVNGCALDLNLKSPSSSEVSSLSEWSPLSGEEICNENDQEDPNPECCIIAPQLASEERSPDDVAVVSSVQVSPEESGSGTEDARRLDARPMDDGRGAEDGGTKPRLDYYFCEEDATEFDYLRMTAKIRRCSSVKISLSSSHSSSPSKKKAVRFADALGLELETVNHIVSSTTADPPSVPTLEVLRGLRVLEKRTAFEPVSSDSIRRVLQLCPCFQLPASSAAFLGRVYDQKVGLESLTVDGVGLSVTGSVCVVNIAYVKRIFVRFTTNGWLDHRDQEAATYLGPSHGGQIDRFQFRIDLPKSSFGFGSRLEFAVRYESMDHVHWDNNFGSNYRVECYYKRVP